MEQTACPAAHWQIDSCLGAGLCTAHHRDGGCGTNASLAKMNSGDFKVRGFSCGSEELVQYLWFLSNRNSCARISLSSLACNWKWWVLRLGYLLPLPAWLQASGSCDAPSLPLPRCKFHQFCLYLYKCLLSTVSCGKEVQSFTFLLSTILHVLWICCLQAWFDTFFFFPLGFCKQWSVSLECLLVIIRDAEIILLCWIFLIA